MINTCNAWIAIEPHPPKGSPSFSDCVLELDGSPKLFSAIADGDWILAVTPKADFTRVGRVLRLRTDTDSTTVYFDRMLTPTDRVGVGTAGLTMPKSDSVSRLQWSAFAAVIEKLTGRNVVDVPLIDRQAYIRELLQLAVTDESARPR